MTLDRLREAVAGDVPNAIMPLFWQKGGPVEVVRTEMERIGDAGIGAVILEARPHPEFLEDGWWRDVDAVLEIARRRGMKVWFFDDDTFPTGHAGGAVASAPPNLRRRFLTERHTDVVGPACGASLLVERTMFFGPAASLDPGRLLRVLAYPRAEDSDTLVGDAIDLTDRIVDGVVHWDVPDGWWRVFFVSETTDGASAPHTDHIDYLNPASTRLLLDAVHEQIHARYADEFGTTIAGFFSDEPGFYNDPDTFDFGSALGKAVPLPWNEHVAAALSAALGEDCLPVVPLLWAPAEGAERRVRSAYMDVVSRLYSDGFSRQLGDWCHAHDVEYIGHVIEDNGAHARLGPGAGHYFRAMAGQDMAGVDIIGGQVVPGFSRGPFANMAGAADGEFFHFGLAKLASSAAHLDPRKAGRSMCETIGASGWYAGLRLFTWLTNHLLVRGVTHVVPHAFSPAPFPDLDCPPHFYAHGKNPQYRYQHLLSEYTNRLSHLLQGGVHVAPFAVLYHADAEWLGAAQPCERPLRVLMEAQLDADIVPGDALPQARAAGAAFTLGEETYDALVVPGSDFLPSSVARELLRLDEAGIPVVFVDRVPRVHGGPATDLTDRFRAVPLAELAEVAASLTSRAVRVAASAPGLRAYRRDLGAVDVVMLMNESTRERVCTTLTVPRAGAVIAFDAVTGTCRRVPFSTETTAGTAVPLDLAPGEASVLLVGDPVAWRDLPVEAAAVAGAPVVVAADWTVATATAQQYPVFTPWRSLDDLVPLDRPELLPRFSGTIRYTSTVAPDRLDGAFVLDLGEVHEIAQVTVNGADLGTRIAPPYRFTIPDGLLTTSSTLEVEVTNTLVKAHPDFFSAFAQQEPTGLLGPVTIAPLQRATPDQPMP
ncbi:hypothetical protein LK09_11815 [Microbacterium mangrovi]|uniref:Glycosyl transferase family 2 n=1 Tax=Microbacterium mangrovi TaxID=1348253 RepID=A0A0B2A722_9MICO|nr:hypothetical protein [Microbacterium mangrovi]KHK97568.1 hypothetical protein LK09_11815 [Microbacterium mangrovi]